jgi:hypothetical protein
MFGRQSGESVEWLSFGSLTPGSNVIHFNIDKIDLESATVLELAELLKDLRLGVIWHEVRKCGVHLVICLLSMSFGRR